MTIEQLLEEAARFAAFAVREADRDRIDNERIMRYCAISQANALTAQAMILASMRTKQDLPALRIFGEVDTS